MVREKDMNYFMSLDFNVVLKKMNEYFYLFIPELSIICEGKNLNEAYEKLQKEKEAYFRKIIAMDAQDTVKEPMPISFRKKIFTDLLMLSVKTLIITAAIIVICLPFISLIDQIPGRTLSLITRLPADMNYKLRNLPPEKKEELRFKLRKAVQDIKPFVDEISPLWEKETKKE